MKKRLIWTSVLIVVSGIAAWTVFSLRDDDSVLSILVRDVAKKMGWAADSTTLDVLQRMEKYDKQGRYDDAIKAGSTWAEEHPNDGSNDLVFRQIALLYLEKAKKDSGHADEYADRAILYRDKALPLASDATLGWRSMAGVRDLALISESAADLSAKQRCPQYQNAIKLLERLAVLLKEQQVAPRGAGFTADDIKTFLNQVDATISRVRHKQQSAGCKLAD